MKIQTKLTTIPGFACFEIYESICPNAFVFQFALFSNRLVHHEMLLGMRKRTNSVMNDNKSRRRSVPEAFPNSKQQKNLPYLSNWRLLFSPSQETILDCISQCSTDQTHQEPF